MANVLPLADIFKPCIIVTIHRFSRLVTLLFHKWLHVRLNHKRRLYLNVNLMTALNYKTWMVQTLKLN